MSLDSIHKQIRERERKELSKMFNKTEDVTVKISLAHLSFIKESILKPFEEAVEAEKDLDKKPATIAYEGIKKFSEEELRKWMVEMVISGYVNEYVRKVTQDLMVPTEEEPKSIIIS